MGNEHAKHKKWFEGLDQDHDGDLGLRELLEIQKLEGDLNKSVLTPSLLFRFDMDQDGSLDIQEFDKLMKHLKKEREKERRKKEDEGDEGVGNGQEGGEVWSVLDQRKASLMNFSRDGDTPLITGQGYNDAVDINDFLAQQEEEHEPISSTPQNSDDEEQQDACDDDDSFDDDDSDDFDPRACNSKPRRRMIEEEDDGSSGFVNPSESVDIRSMMEADDESHTIVDTSVHRVEEDEVIEDDDDDEMGNDAPVQSPPRLSSSVDSNDHESVKIIEDSQKFVSSILSTPEGKKKYMKWLFELADSQDKGQVNVEELSLILKALAMDGLIMQDLVFEDSDAQSDGTDYMDIARRIMKEFDTGKDGVLSQQEFHVLAELIVRKYKARDEEGKIVLGKYRIKRVLGRGAVGVVKLATNIKSNKSVAIKIIESSQTQDFSKIDVEIKAMLMLRHPHVVRLFKVLESNDKIYLVMELCGGGTLADMVRIKPLSESLCRFYMRQLILAMKYCHKQGVIHRDVKLENLLLTNRGNLKISDFGHAGIYREGWDLFSTSLVGSLWHISPEQVNGNVYKGTKIDIWALGVVLYRLLSPGGRPPFYSDVAAEVLDMITHARFPPLEHVSAEANDLIKKILVVAPEERPSLYEIFEHQWMKYGEEVPRLEAIDLILSDCTNVETQWKAMCLTVTELQVVFTVPEDKQRKMEVHRMKCRYTPSDLKLLITEMRVSDKQNDPPFFEFVKKNGETSEFQLMIERIRKIFKQKIAELLGIPVSKSISKGSLSESARKLISDSSEGYLYSSQERSSDDKSPRGGTTSMHSSHSGLKMSNNDQLQPPLRYTK